MNATKSTKILLTCFLFSIVAYVACNKSDSPLNTKQTSPVFRITEGDSIVVDTTIVIRDTVDVLDTAIIDSLCYTQSLSDRTFKIYAKFSGPIPSYVWVKLGSAWYGPIPILSGFVNGTYLYESSWFDQISSNFFELGCLNMKFTYSPYFYSSPSMTRYVCRCRR